MIGPGTCVSVDLYLDDFDSDRELTLEIDDCGRSLSLCHRYSTMCILGFSWLSFNRELLGSYLNSLCVCNPFFLLGSWLFLDR